MRDPRAVIASRNYGQNVIDKYGGKYPIIALIKNWRNNVINSIINDNNDNYLTVKYDELVFYPDLWFKKICSFLGINFVDSILETENFVNGFGKKWKQNTSYKVRMVFQVSLLINGKACYRMMMLV